MSLKNKEPEHAIIVTLKVGKNFGEDKDVKLIDNLCNDLERHIKKNTLGVFDGTGHGEAGYDIFMYGYDAEKFFLSIEPILKKHDITKGATVRLRYGSYDDDSAKEEEKGV